MDAILITFSALLLTAIAATIVYTFISKPEGCRCPECSGKGFVPDGNGWVDDLCKRCSGSGSI